MLLLIRCLSHIILMSYVHALFLLKSTRMISILNMAIGVVVGIVVVVLIEEGIHYLIRRAAKAAGTNSTVIRDI